MRIGTVKRCKSPLASAASPCLMILCVSTDSFFFRSSKRPKVPIWKMTP